MSKLKISHLPKTFYLHIENKNKKVEGKKQEREMVKVQSFCYNYHEDVND